MTSKKENILSLPAVSLDSARPHARSLATPRKPLLLALSALALSVAALPASAAWYTTSPSLTIGTKTVNVRNVGARGDGVHDDTAAIQTAINSLPSTGGTIVVPAGTYRINALKSINLRSHVRLKMDPTAQLVAIPNNQTRSYVVKAWHVNNVEIVGGSIVGERARHIGSTGEWGMGLDIRASSKVFAHDLKISDCWGDGVYIGATGSGSRAVLATDITLNHITSTGNRRQGLSFGPVQRVYVVNSAFLNTSGTAPQAGIDIEPAGQGSSSDIRVEATTLQGNAGNGMELHAHVSGLVVNASTIKGNKGFGVLGVDMGSATISGNTITENGLDGVGATATTHDWQVTGNKVTYNSTRWYIANHKSIYTLSNSARDIQIAGSTRNIKLVSNTLSPKP